ncbi:uncharacterized protein EI97DRAFT_32880 [Westerdykella ornata]|uniref:Uncharacterized protein n=1 Tax=Westerdykella ornata TaxID=318751 RepID=A0A6A6JZC0_WESOR|nr:uncharacterized protein EI97DRAFT_32880 [Westerdykella ornata]KAF2281555.1 hypothetical protein EI97DRAFT_32880 [Westerdykella ornata]
MWLLGHSMGSIVDGWAVGRARWQEGKHGLACWALAIHSALRATGLVRPTRKKGRGANEPFLLFPCPEAARQLATGNRIITAGSCLPSLPFPSSLLSLSPPSLFPPPSSLLSLFLISTSSLAGCRGRRCSHRPIFRRPPCACSVPRCAEILVRGFLHASSVIHFPTRGLTQHNRSASSVIPRCFPPLAAAGSTVVLAILRRFIVPLSRFTRVTSASSDHHQPPHRHDSHHPTRRSFSAT